MPPKPLPSNLKDHWLLHPDITFLNHGSFGATPRPVFEAQNEWRRRLESEPVELLGRRCLDLLHESKTKIGSFLNIPPRDFGLVTNATDGINAVLRSIPLQPKDELLTTNHVYNAVRQSMKHIAERAGATYREIPIPLPLTSQDQITAAITADLFVAMARHRLGEVTAARQILERARAEIEQVVPRAGSHLSGGPENWLICYTVFREAQSIIDGH